MAKNSHSCFCAKIDLIGINPFVFLPEKVLLYLFKRAGKNTSPLPVCGTVNGKKYQQTLVKYAGDWRLYINLSMLEHSTKRIGEQIDITIDYDEQERILLPQPKLIDALNKNPQAKQIFDSLQPSLQKEIIRYISFLKTEKSIDNNVQKAIGFLLGNNRFIGRDPLNKIHDTND